jgi:hypothetical protein
MRPYSTTCLPQSSVVIGLRGNLIFAKSAGDQILYTFALDLRLTSTYHAPYKYFKLQNKCGKILLFLRIFYVLQVLFQLRV